jgi:hypothetical protein
MKSKITRREGFWYSKDEPLLPKPITNKKAWVGKRLFLRKLAIAQSRCESNPIYKGYSTCRICGCNNGCSSFFLKGWEWPSGFYHYVEKHNVRPSLAFQEFVLGSHVEDINKICNRANHACTTCGELLVPCQEYTWACPFINGDENTECPKCEKKTIEEMEAYENRNM